MDAVIVEVPTECRARLRFILDTALELRETFANGNRKTMLEGLVALPPRVAFAVLATIVASAPPEVRRGVVRFLQEAA